MSSAGFQWFVAWRYLMARPRRASAVILAFVKLELALCLAALAALPLAPLADARIAFEPVAPRLLVRGVGAAVGVVAAILLAGLVAAVLRVLARAVGRRDRAAGATRDRRWPRRLIGLAAVALLGLGVIGASARFVDGDPLDPTLLSLWLVGLFASYAVLATWLARRSSWLLWTFAIIVAAKVLTFAVVGVLFAGGRLDSLRELPVGLERVAVLASDPLVLIVALGLASRWPLLDRSAARTAWCLGVATLAIAPMVIALSWMLASWQLVGFLALAVAAVGVALAAGALPLLAGATVAAMVALIGGLAIEGLDAGPSLGLVDGFAPLATHAALLLIALAIGALAVALALRAARRRFAWARTLGLALLAAALIGRLGASYLELTGHAAGELDKYGALMSYQYPMELVIVASMGTAMVALALILLVIRYYFTFFSTVSIGGVMIGSMALVVVLSVMNGFESDMRERILGSNAHILVAMADDAPMTDYRAVTARVARIPDVVAASAFLGSEVVIAADTYSNVVIKGVDPATVGEVTDLDEDVDDPQALDRLWPLAADGSLRPGPASGAPADPAPVDPAPAGDPDAIDPAPRDLEVGGDEPTDFSGGLAEAPPEPTAAGPTGDPAPPDLEVGGGEPIDFSGGLAEAPPDPPRDGGLERGGSIIATEDLETDLDLDELPRVARSEDDRDGVLLLDRERLSRLGVFGPEAQREQMVQLAPDVAVLPGVLVGRELAKQINLYTGREVKIISPLGQDTPLGPVPRTKPYRVAGVFFTGQYEYDLKSIYVELGTLQAFLDVGDEATGIEIRVRDADHTEAAKRAIAAAVGPRYSVKDWKELNRSLFSALKLEKIAMFLVLAIIILVASFSIVGNLIMVVVEKAKEIAVLKTLGASDGGLMQVFIVQGFFIGLVGTLVGVALGLAICWLLETFGLPLDAAVYYIDKLPIHIDPTAIAAVAAAGIVISVIATLYPAYVAARLRPIKGLRYE